MKISHHWWRKEPLSEDECRLVDVVLQCHHNSTKRNNMSAHIFQNSAIGSGRYVNGLIGALASLGGVHAPIEPTMAMLACDDYMRDVQHCINGGYRVMGWGSSFEKGQKDKVWLPVDALLHLKWPKRHAVLESITEALHAHGKDIYPNPSAYTAMTNLIVGIPAWASHYLLIAGRLDGWTELVAGNKS